MREHLPWLSQGDIFTAVPIVTVGLTTAGEIKADAAHGPAVLLDHDCALDKASRAGKPTIQTLHFAPLIAVSSQDDDRQRVLRESRLTPYEVMYLGECGWFGEAFIVLSHMYPLPTDFFAPRAIPWPDHPAAVAEERYCTPSRYDERIGKLDDDQLGMLHRKMNAFWTRLLPKDE